MTPSFKSKMNRGDRLVGTVVTLPAPEIAEILRLAGFDWLFVDLEHSAMGIRDAQAILQAAGPSLPCLVRVPSHDEVWIKRCLDIGAAGIIVPQVRSAEAAERAVRLCKYPPVGERSVGLARAQGFGFTFGPYVADANDTIAVVLQIEHVEAVARLDTILAVPGVDCVFVGPYDLSASMGKPGRTTDPDVQAAIATVRQGAAAAGIPTGIFGSTADAVRPHIEAGFTVIAAGVDTLIFGSAAEQIPRSLKTEGADG